VAARDESGTHADGLGAGDVPVVRGDHDCLLGVEGFGLQHHAARRGFGLEHPGAFHRVDRVQQRGDTGVSELGVDHRLR
jgi:hypothetical protein